MTEPTPDSPAVADSPAATALPEVAADFTAAANPAAPSKAGKAKYVSKPVKQQTVEAMAYVAPDGTQGGNIAELQEFIGPDVSIVPQPSFNVSTGQTCIHVAGQLTQSGDLVVKHPDNAIEVLSEDALAERYTAK